MMSRSMKVKFISTKYWSYFPFFMAKHFSHSPTHRRRRFAYQTRVKFISILPKPPCSTLRTKNDRMEYKTFPEKRKCACLFRREKKEMFNQKLHSLQTHQHNHSSCGRHKKRSGAKGKRWKCTHNALNTIKCDNMAGCDSHSCAAPYHTIPVVVLCTFSHYSRATKKKDEKKKKSLLIPQAVQSSTRFIPYTRHSNTEVPCEQHFGQDVDGGGKLSELGVPARGCW